MTNCSRVAICKGQAAGMADNLCICKLSTDSMTVVLCAMFLIAVQHIVDRDNLKQITNSISASLTARPPARARCFSGHERVVLVERAGDPDREQRDQQQPADAPPPLRDHKVAQHKALVRQQLRRGNPRAPGCACAQASALRRVWPARAQRRLPLRAPCS